VVARAQGMMGPGYGWGMHGQTQATGPVNLDQAVNLVRQALAGYGNPDLVAVEIMEFNNGFYVVVAEKSTKIGAMELIVERNGIVHPEPGPNMMWNTKYGHMGGGQGMMGGPASQQLTREQARQSVQTWLTQAFPGANAEEGMPFYGYFTFDFKRHGKVLGMASVSAFTGAIWYHTWHGTFVREREVQP
jgi:hypothetical protein